MFTNKFTASVDYLINNLNKAFKNIFETENKELKKLLALKSENWQDLSCPTTLSDGSIYIFSYELKLIKQAIFHIKNHKNEELATSMTSIAIPIMESKIEDYGTRVIVACIPSSRHSKINRGYNPSELLAKSLSKQLGAHFLPNLLVKTRETESQKELSRSKRLSNVTNSMKPKDKYLGQIKDSIIIIVDDVVTTGATLREAKRSLGNLPKQIICLALSH